MSNLPDYISSTRMPAPTPDSIVENGKVHFGTFDAPFKNLNLLDAVKPCGNKMPDFMKPSRLVEWEAFEVHMDEGALISAVYSTGPMGFSIFVWYDKKENKIYSWRNLVHKKKAHVASQLVDDCCYCKTKTSEYKIENDFLHGKARAKGFTKGKNGEFTIDIRFERISPPCQRGYAPCKKQGRLVQKRFVQRKGFLQGKRHDNPQRQSVHHKRTLRWYHRRPQRLLSFQRTLRLAHHNGTNRR